MSSTSCKIPAQSYVGCERQPVVKTLQEQLADYVRRVIAEKELNYREVARRSGGLISHSTVYDIINERNKNVSTKTLQGLAKGLGVSEDELFAVARGKSESGDLQLNEMRLLEYFRQLSPDNQDALLMYAEMMSQRSSAIERTKGAKLPISSIFSQGSKRSSKKRTG